MTIIHDSTGTQHKISKLHPDRGRQCTTVPNQRRARLIRWELFKAGYVVITVPGQPRRIIPLGGDV